MKLRIYAHFCEFKRERGYKSVTHCPLDPMPLVRDNVEVKNAAELNAALDDAFAAMRAAHPGRSFFIAEYAPRNAGRAFAGYNKGRWVREFDSALDNASTAA